MNNMKKMKKNEENCNFSFFGKLQFLSSFFHFFSFFYHFFFQWCKNFPKNGKLQLSSGFFIFLSFFFIIFASSGGIDEK